MLTERFIATADQDRHFTCLQAGCLLKWPQNAIGTGVAKGRMLPTRARPRRPVAILAILGRSGGRRGSRFFFATILRAARPRHWGLNAGIGQPGSGESRMVQRLFVLYYWLVYKPFEAGGRGARLIAFQRASPFFAFRPFAV